MQIVWTDLYSSSLVHQRKWMDISEQLIEITADGIVDETEVAAFDAILDELERMSVNIQSLMLWAQKNRDALKEKNN